MSTLHFTPALPRRPACSGTWPGRAAAVGALGLLSGLATGGLAAVTGHWYVGALLLAPWLEEAVFRVGLQDELRYRGWPPLPAAIATAIAFALAHLAIRAWETGSATPAATAVTAATVLPALLIGVVYERSRSLPACIALHTLFNAVWLLGPGAVLPGWAAR